MYRAFNLSNCNWSNIPAEPGNATYQRNSAVVRQSLDLFIKNITVDGTELISQWFPKVNADVFISHSHSDRDDAIKFASWIERNFDLIPFVDSSVWGHAGDLLKIIDREFCFNENNGTYDYDKRNGSTSYVHMMLSTALCSMIDSTECVFFLNTPSSLSSTGSINRTQSPWLFFELESMRTIRRRKPGRMIVRQESFATRTKQASLKMEFEVPLDHLTSVDGKNLDQWASSFKELRGESHALDVLYKATPGITGLDYTIE